MTDRELLELAAKAAGVDLVWDGDKPKEVVIHWSGNPECGGETRGWDWNPLLDDGDALRLAVKLRLDVLFSPDAVEAMANTGAEIEPFGIAVNTDDRAADARRAIVRAAAEIGRLL